MEKPLTDDQLRLLAADAIDVLAWAMRNRMKKPQQVDEAVKAFRMRFAQWQEESMAEAPQ